MVVFASTFVRLAQMIATRHESHLDSWKYRHGDRAF